MAQLQGVLRNADGAGSGLDASRFEGRHQLLETLPLDLAQQAIGGNFGNRRRRSRIPSCRDSRGQRISPPLMPGAGKGISSRAARLLGDEHRQARDSLSAGSVRASNVIISARAAWVIQVLLPVTR